MNSKIKFNNYMLFKALEEVDEQASADVISCPNLDRKELASIIDCSLTGSIVNKYTKEPINISNKNLMSGLRNLLNQVIRESNNEI